MAIVSSSFLNYPAYFSSFASFPSIIVIDILYPEDNLIGNLAAIESGRVLQYFAQIVLKEPVGSNPLIFQAFCCKPLFHFQNRANPGLQPVFGQIFKWFKLHTFQWL